MSETLGETFCRSVWESLKEHWQSPTQKRLLRGESVQVIDMATAERIVASGEGYWLEWEDIPPHFRPQPIEASDA